MRENYKQPRVDHQLHLLPRGPAEARVRQGHPRPHVIPGQPCTVALAERSLRHLKCQTPPMAVPWPVKGGVAQESSRQHRASFFGRQLCSPLYRQCCTRALLRNTLSGARMGSDNVLIPLGDGGWLDEKRIILDLKLPFFLYVLNSGELREDFPKAERSFALRRWCWVPGGCGLAALGLKKEGDPSAQRSDTGETLGKQVNWILRQLDTWL